MTDRTHIPSSAALSHEFVHNGEPDGIQTKYRLVVLLGVVAVLSSVNVLLLALDPVIAGGLAVSIGVIGWLLPGEYAFAGGHLGVGVVFPAEPNAVALTLIELSLWMLLILESGSLQSALRLGMVGWGIACLLAVLAWATLYQAMSLWRVGLVSAGIIGFALYAVHRYEIVQLGLVEEANT